MGEIGIVRVRATDWEEFCRPYALILTLADAGRCELAWRNEASEQHQLTWLESGQIGFVAPGVLQSGRWQQETQMTVILVRPSYLGRILGEQGWSGMVVGDLAQAYAKDPLILLLAELCSSLLLNHRSDETPFIEELARVFTCRLIQAHFESTPTRRSGTTFTPSQHTRIREFMAGRIASAKDGLPSVGDLARVVGLSPLHFTRLFTETMGVSPKRYLNACLIQRAGQMIREGNYRIEEVANSLGFNDAGYFSRVFRSAFKMSPTEYRTLHRQAKH